MINLHPALSGLPLASLIFICAGEMLVCSKRFRAFRDPIRVAGVCFLVASVACAFFSGYSEVTRAGELEQAIEDAMARHHSMGRLLLLNSLALASFFFIAQIASHGRRLLLGLYYLTLCIQVALTLYVGFLGGELVFKHAVNVVDS